jgi:hypothetical protein
MRVVLNLAALIATKVITPVPVGADPRRPSPALARLVDLGPEPIIDPEAADDHALAVAFLALAGAALTLATALRTVVLTGAGFGSPPSAPIATL